MARGLPPPALLGTLPAASAARTDHPAGPSARLAAAEEGQEEENRRGGGQEGQEKGEEEEQEGRTALDRPRHTVLQFAGPSGKRRLSWASTETERATQELRPPKKMAPSVLGKLCFKSRFHRSRQPP
ncbi:unnamed protein product [Prorocentrum cordatum]|uniref:Uncharacterized protein n=1 Tax=Prorocentrum cordatum TaxID=2364126 RepID=A0ABN9RP21_9DINO|nr:unnamed protein product [Polarella glacialis]